MNSEKPLTLNELLQYLPFELRPAEVPQIAELRTYADEPLPDAFKKAKINPLDFLKRLTSAIGGRIKNVDQLALLSALGRLLPSAYEKEINRLHKSYSFFYVVFILGEKEPESIFLNPILYHHYLNAKAPIPRWGYVYDSGKKHWSHMLCYVLE